MNEYDETIEIGRRTWMRCMDSVEKNGFREGVAAGRNDALQEGFDLGYKFGFELASQRGSVKAKERFGSIKSPDSENNKVVCIICSSRNADISGSSLEEIREKQKTFDRNL